MMSYRLQSQINFKSISSKHKFQRRNEQLGLLDHSKWILKQIHANPLGQNTSKNTLNLLDKYFAVFKIGVSQQRKMKAEQITTTQCKWI